MVEGLVISLVGGSLVLGVATGMNTVVVVVTAFLTDRLLVDSDFGGTEVSFGTTRVFGFFFLAVVVVEPGIPKGSGGTVIS